MFKPRLCVLIVSNQFGSLEEVERVVTDQRVGGSIPHSSCPLILNSIKIILLSINTDPF